MSITVATFHARLREFLEDGGSGTSWGDDELALYMTRAKKAWYRLIMEVNPDYPAPTRIEFTWAANQTVQSYATLLTGAGLAVSAELRMLQQFPRVEAFSDTNWPFPVAQVPHTEIGWRSRLDPGVGDAIHADSLPNAFSGSGESQYVWSLSGQVIHLEPTPQIDTKFQLLAIGAPAAVSMAATSATYLDDRDEAWEFLLQLWAASYAKGRTSEQRASIGEDLAGEKAQFMLALQRARRVAGAAKMVRHGL